MPTTDAVTDLGTLTEAAQASGAPVTTAMASFEAEPTPPARFALTRRKIYVPSGMPFAENDVVLVSTLVIFASPEAVPASMT